MKYAIKWFLIPLVIFILVIELMSDYEFQRFSYFRVIISVAVGFFLITLISKQPLTSRDEIARLRRTIDSREPVQIPEFLRLCLKEPRSEDLVLAKCYLQTIGDYFSVDTGKIQPDDRFSDYFNELDKDAEMADYFVEAVLNIPELESNKDIDTTFYRIVTASQYLNIGIMTVGDLFLFIRNATMGIDRFNPTARCLNQDLLDERIIRIKSPA